MLRRSRAKHRVHGGQLSLSPSTHAHTYVHVHRRRPCLSSSPFAGELTDESSPLVNQGLEIQTSQWCGSHYGGRAGGGGSQAGAGGVGHGARAPGRTHTELARPQGAPWPAGTALLDTDVVQHTPVEVWVCVRARGLLAAGKGCNGGGNAIAGCKLKFGTLLVAFGRLELAAGARRWPSVVANFCITMTCLQLCGRRHTRYECNSRVSPCTLLKGQVSTEHAAWSPAHVITCCRPGGYLVIMLEPWRLAFSSHVDRRAQSMSILLYNASLACHATMVIFIKLNYIHA